MTINPMELKIKIKRLEQMMKDNDEKFLITCNIYDLDLKSKMKYKHWLKVENDLQEIYNSSNPNWRCCIKYDQIHH